MNIQENVPLSAHSTMQLGGPARYLADIASRNDLTEALTWAAQKQLPVMMIGTGSNIIWGDKGFAGLVLVNKITGFEIQDIDASSKYLIVGGGENWDSVVARAVEPVRHRALVAHSRHGWRCACSEHRCLWRSTV